MNKTPETVSEAYPSTYLTAADLKGADVTVEIAAVRTPNADDKGTDGKMIEGKMIVRFKGAKKEWVMAKTCAKTIEMLYGERFADWTGKKIKLFPDTCRAFGKSNVPCVRVRPINPETGKGISAI